MAVKKVGVGGGGWGRWWGQGLNSRSELAEGSLLPFAVVFYTQSRTCPGDPSELVLVTGGQMRIVLSPELGSLRLDGKYWCFCPRDIHLRLQGKLLSGKLNFV